MPRIVVGAVIVALAAVVVSMFILRARDRGPVLELVLPTEHADYEYVIPAGTAAAIERGEKPTLIPRRLDAKVGEVIRIRNQDTIGQQIGPFYVGAGETLTQRFASPGEFTGECAVHPSGRFTLHVSG
jgi:hypothetical protein